MLATKKAVCVEGKTAKDKSQCESYPKATSLSSKKLKIGTLLLVLQNPLSREQQEKGWQVLDILLRQYLDFKYSGVSI